MTSSASRRGTEVSVASSFSATRSPYLPRRRLGWRTLALAGAAAVAGFIPLAVNQLRALAQPACRSMQIVVDLTDAPPDAMADVVEAAARLQEATGVPLLVDRSTNPVTTGDRVRVSWRELPAVDERTSLVGWTQVGDPAAGAVEGTVVLNSSHPVRSGFDTRASWGGALLHELGHAVGLAHTTDPVDLMHPRQHEGPLVWGPGDKAQLATIASRWGCPSR